MEKDSPSSRKTKSSFIRRLAIFGIVSSFSSIGKKNKFRAYPSNRKIAELSEALGSALRFGITTWTQRLPQDSN